MGNNQPNDNHEYHRLCQQVEAGRLFHFLPFWGPIPTSGKKPGKGVLCQWWYAPFSLAGKSYHTAEHYMMAQKARLFSDARIEQRILDSNDPSEAQYLGRKVAGYQDDVWASARFDIVVEGNRHKFAQNPALRDYLLSTGDSILVSANPTDRIWSIGYDEDHPAVCEPSCWRGANLLGFALMRVRAELRLEIALHPTPRPL